MIRVLDGDMRDVVPTLDRIDAVVTDPPYEIGMMNKHWDKTGVAFQADTWWPVFTALKPGGHLVAFGSTRTFHRLVCAIEDAGFEIRDTLMWITSQGFPKSHDISKAIDKAAGAEREVIGLRQFADGTTARATAGQAGVPGSGAAGQAVLTAPATPEAACWQGWGSALKPAMELICLARKPLEGTLAQNTLKHGVGGLNIDACRVPASEGDYDHPGNSGIEDRRNVFGKFAHGNQSAPSQAGRWPANVLHDGSDEVLEAFAAHGEGKPKAARSGVKGGCNGAHLGGLKGAHVASWPADEGGSAARFFYSAKADKADRADSRHPTVKPLDLIIWLTKLVCPPGGTVLDPFAGSGVTAEACMLNGFDCILVEKNPEYCRDIRHRIRRWSGEDCPLFAEVAD